MFDGEISPTPLFPATCRSDGPRALKIERMEGRIDQVANICGFGSGKGTVILEHMGCPTVKWN